MNIPEEAVEAVKSVLRDEGLTENGGNPHSWRCEHPDRYPDYCTCVADLARAALSAAAPYLMAREVVTTVAELESLELPDGTVLMDARGNPWKLVWDDEVVDYWITTGSEWGHANTDMPLPAIILYTPKEAL